MASDDLTLRHLYVELARLDLLIHRRVSLLDQAMHAVEAAEPGARQLHMTLSDALRILQQPFGELPNAPSARADESYMAAFEEVQEQIALIVEESEGMTIGSRLVHLAAVCEMSRFDLDVFLIALAPAVDLRYERLYGFLHDDLTRRRATVNLMLDLLCEPGPDRLAHMSHFAKRAPLMREHLLEPVAEPGILQPVLLNQAFAPNSSVVAWLLGDYQPEDALADFVEYEPSPRVARAAISDAQRQLLLDTARADAFVALVGKDRGAQRNVQRTFALACGAPLLVFDMQAAVRSALGYTNANTESAENIVADQSNVARSSELRELLRTFLRDARLTNAVAAITGWESSLVDGAPPATLFALVCNHRGPITIASAEMWRSQAVPRERRLTWIDLPIPDYVQRKHILGDLLDPLPADEEMDVAGIAGRFTLSTGQMEDMIATAQDHARQAGALLRNEDLFAAARLHSSPRLSTLARKLTLRYDWEDLVLPEDQITRLRELVEMVQGRAQVLDEWGLSRKLTASYGVSALFAGSPGTGKTMAAEVIARALGLDVFKIDLSGMVSKYIGETEKNLEKVFAEAESTSAILFFDEADAIFGKRSEVRDAHDRYANIETSYLLQRMEAYDGVTILATNLRANLDEAFTRRLHSVVDFPFPDEQQRLRIWTTLFPADVPHDESVDLELLARRFKLAGGSIRNIVVAAAYFASAEGSVIGMEHLLHATRRELQKLGRLTDERDFTPARV